MFKATLLRVFNSMGYQVIRSSTSFSEEELTVMKRVKPYTSTSPERIVGLMNAVKYITANRIPGALVECGVWRGGSTMAAIYTLLSLKDTSRDVHLFDTFEGMSAPTDKDVMFDGQKASEILAGSERKEGPGNYWCIAGIEDVRNNVHGTGYPKEKIHLVKGKVEETIPQHAPAQIALLRLDTDWYESTAHEMKHLYPRVSPNGIVIIDDYGHWQGARRAVDEYFAGQAYQPLLNRLDYTGRLLVKTA
jgi:O-methyltransferase